MVKKNPPRGKNRALISLSEGTQVTLSLNGLSLQVFPLPEKEKRALVRLREVCKGFFANAYFLLGEKEAEQKTVANSKRQARGFEKRGGISTKNPPGLGG